MVITFGQSGQLAIWELTLDSSPRPRMLYLSMSEMIEAGKTAAEGMAFAEALSIKNPGMYVTLYTCFGLYALLSKRLHVFAPTDSWGDVYWLNGNARLFTENQRIADQNATPTMR